jgi:capsular exopolysaccharide synthesis family protein
VGLVIGTAIVLLLDRLDASIRSIDEAESVLGIPVLAALPRLPRREAKQSHLMVMNEPDSGFSEGIRSARTSILLSTLDVPGRVLVITSSLENEGKTTVSMNLALAQSQTKRTLLIEGDLRRRSYAQLLGVPPGLPGLSDVLSGDARPEDAIFRMSGQALCIMTAGKGASNPLELISSGRLIDLIQGLKQHYDMIIIDTPPLALVSDAAVFCTVATSAIMVIRGQHTARQLAQQSLRKLAHSPATVLGTILNQLDFKRARSYYGEYNSPDGYGGYKASRAKA